MDKLIRALILILTFHHISGNISKFIIRITQDFPECSLFFFKNTPYFYPNLHPEIVQKTNLISYNFILNETFKNFQISIKHSSNCKLILTLSPHDAFFEKFKIFTPVFKPILHKERDHFIFITKIYQINKILLSKVFPGKVKYKIAVAEVEGFQLIVRSVCFFCKNGEPQIVQHKMGGNYFPDYVKDLNGKVLKISFPAILSRIEINEELTLNNGKRGMWKNLFHDYLMVKFNFSYQMFLSSGGGTGTLLNNGTWIGTVGDVASEFADLGIVTTKSHTRVQQTSFTNSFFDISYLNFITRQGEQIYSPLVLLWSFDFPMWVCIFASTLFAFFMFFALTKGMVMLGLNSARNMGYARRGKKSRLEWGLKHQIFFVTTSYLDQDSLLPSFGPLRCFVAFWLCFCLIITTVYRSKMVSLLAFPRIEKIPQTYSQLVNSDYQLGFIRHGDSAYNAIKASNDKVYKKLFQKMHVISNSGLECMQKVLTTKYGCIAYSVSTIYLKARNLSDADTRKMVFGPETTYKSFMGLVMQGGSIYLENFDRYLRWTRPLHLADIWEKLDMYYVRLQKQQYWRDTGQFEKFYDLDKGHDDILGLKNISGAFYLLVICLGTSFVVFGVEVVFSLYLRDFFIMIVNEEK